MTAQYQPLQDLREAQRDRIVAELRSCPDAEIVVTAALCGIDHRDVGAARIALVARVS